MAGPTLTATTGKPGQKFVYYFKGDTIPTHEVELDDLTFDIEGEHLCELTGITDSYLDKSEEFGDKWKLSLLWTVVEGDWEGSLVSVRVGFSMHENAHLCKIAEALMHQKIEDGMEINLGDLLGQRGHVYFVSRTSARGHNYALYKSIREYTPRTKPTRPVAAGAQPPARKAAPAPASIDDDPYDGLEDDES